MFFITPKNILPAPDTQAYRILALTAVCGELPAAVVPRLTGGSRYKELVVMKLKQKKLLRGFSQDQLRGYRLGRRAKTLLLASRPERFSAFLSGNTDTNHIKSEVERRQRLHRIAAATVLAMNAGAKIFPDEKPDVFHLPDSTGLPPDAAASFDTPAFYSSREIKAMGVNAIRIRGSRMAGILLTHSAAYLMYQGGVHLPELDHKAEQRTMAWMRLLLSGSSFSGRYTSSSLHAILTCDGMQVLTEILLNAHTSRRAFFLLEDNHSHFYFLTNDRHGDILLRLLEDANKRAAFEQRLFAEQWRPSRGLPVEHDAIDAKGRPVLFACLPDIPRLARFLSGLALHGMEGCVVCFDFQAQALRACCKENVFLLAICFEQFEKEWLQ